MDKNKQGIEELQKLLNGKESNDIEVFHRMARVRNALGEFDKSELIFKNIEATYVNHFEENAIDRVENQIEYSRLLFKMRRF